MQAFSRVRVGQNENDANNSDECSQLFGLVGARLY